MPFQLPIFLENVNQRLCGTIRNELDILCQTYALLSSPKQKTRCLHSMMAVLDHTVDQPTRRTIMEACGRACLGLSTLEKARRLHRHAGSLDDLLVSLNNARIGGGHLCRTGDVIHASYDRCYCGAVSRTGEPFSSTYCYCSCGWLRRLFESLLEKPIAVELESSIIQGHDRCRFHIHVGPVSPGQ